MPSRPRLSLLAAVCLLTLSAYALDPVYTSWGKAIKGYDPVAYFTQSKPVKGDRDFTYRWQGATWYFASAANRDAFQAAPEKYAPAYGGYCAYAVSQNTTAKIDPTAWAIVDGTLYLNYSLDIQKKWEANRAAFITAADANWPKLLDK